MEVLQNRKMKNPFLIKGKQCIVVPTSPHVIRIFYDGHVYDVLFNDEELHKWVTSSGTEWRRQYIKTLLETELIPTESTIRNASIEDGYIA